MMKHFFASSVLDADNKMECGQCARKTAVEKRVLLTKAPPYLVCTVKRMDFDFKAQKSIKFLHQVNR
jgi:ubiquitin C-terminal hydrolase